MPDRKDDPRNAQGFEDAPAASTDAPVKEAPKQKNPLLRLLDYAGSRKKLMVLGCVLSAVNAVLTIAVLVCVWFVARDFIAVAPHWEQAGGAVVYGAWALGFAIAAAFVYCAALMCTHLTAFRTARNMRAAALGHLSKVPLGYFSMHATGELRRVIEGSTGLTETVLAHRMPDFVGALVTPVAFVVVMLWFDWVLGLVCLIPIVVSALCMVLMMGGGMRGREAGENSNVMTFTQNYQSALVRMNKAAVEYVRGIPVVKVFQQTVESFKTFRESIESYSALALAYVKLCEKPQIAQLVAINATFAVLVPAGILAAAAAPDFGVFLTNFLFYVIFSAITTVMMSKVMYSSQAITKAQDALMRLDEILAQPVAASPHASALAHPRDASVTFEDVSFTYPGNDAAALQGVSLSVPAGATVALVGPSGGGKTTAASLVPRFWDVDAGRVLIGGADVRSIPPHELMENVAFVFQNCRLFKQSLAENIAAACPQATRAQIEAAAHAAQCDDIIAKLPCGLDTVVGTRGVYLSGGEQQRVALARAILKDAPIVVLDEATAFADPENESLIWRALDKLTEGKTVLMIAHRLSTVVNVDTICVLDRGRMVETGRHDELLAAGGLYARMWTDYQTAVSWRIGKGDTHAA